MRSISGLLSVFALLLVGCPDPAESTECGNGVVEQGEDCDPGRKDTAQCDYAGGEGEQACTKVICGDGYLNTASGEQCDDGNGDNGDGCPDAEGGLCRPAFCGDGFIWIGLEQCDSAGVDTVDCDFASGALQHAQQACTVAECGDGYVNTAAGETCDDGNANNFDSCPDGPSGSCQPAFCGDLFVWNTDGGRETCDQGPVDSATCVYASGTGEHACTSSSCGDGYVNRAAGENCDDGDNDQADNCPDGLDGTCQPAVCGDGFRWWREGCDEGVLEDTATCNGVGVYACTVAVCGDGYVNATAGEVCDTGRDTVDCDHDSGTGAQACTPNECGDGYVNATTEQCDTAVDTASCDFAQGQAPHACTLAYCGDGYTNNAAGEQCDTRTDSSDCDMADGTGPHACTSAVCGDYYQNAEAQEQCDGGPQDMPSCVFAGGQGAFACKISRCGDGYHNVAAAEQCDDGSVDTQDCDYASGNTAHSCTHAGCGDGYTNSAAGEDCDGGEQDSPLCNFAGGSGPFACTTAVCGDTYVNSAADEECDEGGDTSRCNYDQGTGDLACRLAFCGDGYANAQRGEACDDGNSEVGDDCHPTCLVQSFTSPAAVHSNAASDSGDDLKPDIDTDGLGTWAVVWQSSEAMAGLDADDDILLIQSLDNGASWSPPTSPLVEDFATEDTGNDRFPVVVAGDVWRTLWSSDSEFLFQSSGNDFDIYGGWGLSGWDLDLYGDLSVFVSGYGDSETGNDSFPQMATDGQGRWVAVWQSNEDFEWISYDPGEDYDIFWQRWGAPPRGKPYLNTNAETDSGDDVDPQIVSDGQGCWLAAWMSNESSGGLGGEFDIMTSHSTDHGDDWSAPQPLNNNATYDTGSDNNPRIATDRNGNWVAIWTSQDSLDGTIGGDWDIMYAFSHGCGGSWSDPLPLDPAAFEDTAADINPTLVADGQGNWLALWTSHNSRDGLGTDLDIMASRVFYDGMVWSSWTPPAPLFDRAYHDDGNDRFPKMATDALGVWIVVWESQDSLNDTIGDDWDVLYSVGQPPQ